MRKTIKFVGIAASLALGLMPIMAEAQIHAHPSHQTLTNMPRVPHSADSAAFEANYARFRPEQPALPSCGSNCEPMQMYGIGY